jgi:hypothetical protein
LFIDLLISPRAVFSDIIGEISPDLQPPWNAVYPDAVETIGTESNGDRRVRHWFAVPPGGNRAFLRARLEP